MSDSKAVREWMQTHSGEKCSACGTSYRECTKKMLKNTPGVSSSACCDECQMIDMHAVQWTTEVDTDWVGGRLRPAVPPSTETTVYVDYDIIRTLVEAVDEIQGTVSSWGNINTARITINETTVIVTVNFDGPGDPTIGFTQKENQNG